MRGWTILWLGLLGAAHASPTVQSGVHALGDKVGATLVQAGDLRLAVLPFEELDPSAAEHHLGRLSAELLSARLSTRPNLLQVERARLDAVVTELKRGQKGELQPGTAASVGKLVGANTVVVGTVAAAGPEFILTARAVDAESGRILGAADERLPRTGLVALSEDLVELKSPGGAALRSAAVPGWGQIYNGDTGRGALFMSAALVAAAGAGASAFLGSQAESEYQENRPETVDRRADANDHYDRATWALVGLGAIWVASVADAYLSGEDRVIIDVEGGQP